MEDDDNATFSVLEAAFANSGLTEPSLDQASSFISAEAWDKFVIHTLQQAGVDVELTKAYVGKDEPGAPFSAVQIVSEDVMRRELAP